MNTKRPHPSAGFTLIELMIVVAIIGILTTFAYSSYEESQRKARRAEAKATLLDYSQQMERCYTANGSYNNAACSLHDGANLEAQYAVTKEGYYNVTLTNVTATTFSFTAAATFADPQCASFTVNQAGAKTANDDAGAASAVCW